MNFFMTYILIGIVFMFILEHFTNTKKFKKYITNPKAILPFGWNERLMGILFWPISLGIFIYHFIKEFFK